MAAAKRYTAEQTVAKLREAEKFLGQGVTIPGVCKKLGVSEQTFYGWRLKYGAMKEDEAHRLKALEQENASRYANGNRTKVSYPSGEKVNYAVNSNGRVKTITGYHNGSGTAFVNRALSYTDTAGKDRSLLKTSVDGVGSTTTSTYGYDVYQRLLSDAVGSTAYGYSYDQAGNRLTATKTGTSTQFYGYNNANQLCWSGTTTGSQGTTSCPSTPAGDSSYTYDLDGNLNGGSLGGVSYNPANQTTSTTIGGSSTSFGYAGTGQAERTGVNSTVLINGLEGVAGQTNGTSIYFTRDPDGVELHLRSLWLVTAIRAVASA